MSWLDSFPHSFHGWGPLAPEAAFDRKDYLVITNLEADTRRPAGSWLDSFPHSFHGWGPLSADVHESDAGAPAPGGKQRH